jgi:DNA-binding CsgD family transcriptional regulator
VLLLAAFLLEQPVGLLVAILLGGAGVGSLQVLWGERFAAHPPQFSTLVAPAAAIVTALVVALTSETTSLIALVLFPLASLALLFMHTDTHFGAELFPCEKGLSVASGYLLDKIAINDSHPQAQRRQLNTSRTDVIKLMFSIALFSFLCRSYDSFLALNEDPFAFIGGASLLSLIVVGVAFLVFAFFAKNRFNATLTYRLSLPIMVIGLAALALFLDRFVAISLLTINVGYEFFDILIWILFAEIARRQGNPFRIFGLGVAFTFVGMASGYTLAPLLHDFLTLNGMPSQSFALLSIISLVVVAFLVVPESTLAQLTSFRSNTSGHFGGKDSNELSEENTFEGRLGRQCGVVASKFGLTARELEVLLLLARGRTLAIIARDLQIANSTARTHIENIYTKLDVHKQQELIDFVDSYPVAT